MNNPTSAFVRLADLLRDAPPPRGVQVLDLHLGEPRFECARPWLASLGGDPGWQSYPPLGGTPRLRQAYDAWLDRHFGVGPMIAEGRMATEPTPGTKQAVATLIDLAVRRQRERSGRSPVVVLPNPFYPTYVQAARHAAADISWYEAMASDLPARVAAAAASAEGGLSAIVLCHPASPRGDCLDAGALTAILHTARAYDVPLLVDECYVDIHDGTPPAGMLKVLRERRFSADGLVVLHTLSKRSCAGGLRCGQLAGDPAWVARYAEFNRGCGVSPSWPACEAAAALWTDESHVESLREQVQCNWDVADELLSGLPGYRRSATGFFLWLPVADDRRAARELWSGHGVRTMPGTFLGAADAAGRNPGSGYLRAALVHPPDVMREALTRLRGSCESEARNGAVLTPTA